MMRYKKNMMNWSINITSQCLILKKTKNSSLKKIMNYNNKIKNWIKDSNKRKMKGK
jgi:hypothetical protein